MQQPVGHLLSESFILLLLLGFNTLYRLHPRRERNVLAHIILVVASVPADVAGDIGSMTTHTFTLFQRIKWNPFFFVNPDFFSNLSSPLLGSLPQFLHCLRDVEEGSFHVLIFWREIVLPTSLFYGVTPLRSKLFASSTKLFLGACSCLVTNLMVFVPRG